MYKQATERSAIVSSKELSNQKMIYQFFLLIVTPNLLVVLLWFSSLI